MNKKDFVIIILAIISTFVITTAFTIEFLCPLFNKREEYKEKEFVISMKEKCQEEGKKTYLEDVNRFKDYEVCDPLYNYIEDWNTCVYYGCYKEKESIIEEWIMDIYKNKVIASKSSSNFAEFSLDLEYEIVGSESAIIDLSSLGDVKIFTSEELSSFDWSKFISTTTPWDINTSSWVIATTSPLDISDVSRTVFPVSDSISTENTGEFEKLKEKLFGKQTIYE